MKKWDKLNLPKYKISEKSITYNCIINTLGMAGWAMTDNDDWSLLITSPLMSNDEAKSVIKNK